MAEKNIPADVHVEHVQKIQFKYYNIVVIGAMCFASMGMGYSASIIGTTLGILIPHSRFPCASRHFCNYWQIFNFANPRQRNPLSWSTSTWTLDQMLSL